MDGRVSEAEGGRIATGPPARSSGGRRSSRDEGVWYPRWFWPAFVVPSAIVLLFLFVLPFYAVVGVAFGRLDPIFRNPIPVWNPLRWDRVSFTYVLSNIGGADGIYWESVIRTLFFVGASTAICLLIGYPFAYFLARHAGRWKPVFLIAFFAPFLVSYMMRMTAWVNLLQDDGYLNEVLHWLGIMKSPYPWLSGKSVTVILGLVYGYVPLVILPLYAALDRIPQSHLEASRDLGASPASTFLRITLPASKQAILAGTILAGLSMFGDYFTNQFLAGTVGTQMVGNWIVDSLADPLLVPRGAALSLLLTVILIPPIIYYLRSTRAAARDVMT